MNDYSSYKPISTVPGKEQMRLLQITPANNDDNDELECVLFDFPPTEDRVVYIALSYCWGDMSRQRKIKLIHHSFNDEEDIFLGTQDGLTQIAVDKARYMTFNVTETLYQALRSLRKSASELKERFPILDVSPIWVDALCINQNNINERNSQVGIMRSIYSKAMYVFIWMGEEKEVVRGLHMIIGLCRLLSERFGDAFDLLNMSERQLRYALHTIRYKFEEDDELLGSHGCMEVLELFFANQYFQRIWVLQEATCNAQSTFIHITNAQVPWRYILVADSLLTLHQKLYRHLPKGQLSLAWSSILRARLLHAKEVHQKRISDKTYSHNNEHCSVLGRLYPLFKLTFRNFQASDPRDKLYALLDFAQETVRNSAARAQLAPDYNKSTSQVFTEFTRWCVQYVSIDALTLVTYGPRRFLAQHQAALRPASPSCPDARIYPSWAIWPEAGGWWEQGRVVDLLREKSFDLASKQQGGILDLASHPSIKLPDTLTHRFLSPIGRCIAIAKSIVYTPLKVIRSSKADDPILKVSWTDDETTREMEKYPQSHRLLLSHPHREEPLEAGIATLWYLIKHGKQPSIFLGNDAMETVPSQEWLGIKGGRYEGKEEIMFHDFVETLLMSSIYHGGDGSFNQQPESSLDGPWCDADVAASIAMCWALEDPAFSLIPQKIGDVLKENLFARSIPQPKMLPFLVAGVGKCFFITEDERMGLCPPDTRPGDVIVAFHGSGVPFVLRPVRKDQNFDGLDWSFEGCEQLKDMTYRFIGECYVHECMSSDFLEDQNAKLEAPKVFNLW